MPRENGFENKRVVIVGGSSGIGFAVAQEEAAQGAKVIGERAADALRSDHKVELASDLST
jgi:NAD(P)-dependent dehydrogenase (short-subunit alcohol dehydrogenase family)